MDIALAALFVVAGVIELSLIDSQGESRAADDRRGGVALSSLAFRRRDALLAAVLFVVPAIGQALAGGYLTTDTHDAVRGGPLPALLDRPLRPGPPLPGRRRAPARWG